MRNLFIALTLVILAFCCTSVDAQKTTNPITYSVGAPITCIYGRLYVDATTGFIYSYKTGTGCIIVGTISGSGIANRIAFWDGISSLSSTSGFTFSSNNLSIPAGGQFQINGSAFNFTNLAGNIAVSQMNSGTSASSSTFWRGDGSWQTVSTTSGTNYTITGTGGLGYLELPNQSSNPATPTSAARFFMDSSNRFSWKGTNGFVRTFDGTANTADRIYILPDIAGTIALTSNITSPPFDDGTTIVKGSADTSKLLRFEVDGFTTATTRVITPPNANTSLPIYGATITYTGPTAARTVTYPDSNFTIARTDAANTFTGIQTFSNNIVANSFIVFTNAIIKTGGTNAVAFRNSGDTDYAISIASKFRALDTGGNIQIGLSQSNAGQIELLSNGRIDFSSSSTSANSTKDLGIWHSAAGIAEINDGTTLGAYRDLRLRSLIGTTTNDAGAAGAVGEFVSSLVATGSAISLTTATAANVTSISLTAGDWDVSGNCNFNDSAATVTNTTGGISSTSVTLPTDGSEVYNGVQLVTATTVDSVTLQAKRFSLSGTTTVYLVCKQTFSTGSATAFGSISARRVR